MSLYTTLYQRQPSATTFSYSYPLQTQAGSNIEVNASCIFGGSITRTLVVAGSAGPAPVAPDLQAPMTQAAAGITPVLGLAFLLLWRKAG
jgi:hypothetical protein